MSSADTPILEVEAVSKHFGRFVALNKVTASFQPRKLSAIVGPNGAGKSTFFNVVSGAFLPTEGRLGRIVHKGTGAQLLADREIQDRCCAV